MYAEVHILIVWELMLSKQGIIEDYKHEFIPGFPA